MKAPTSTNQPSQPISLKALLLEQKRVAEILAKATKQNKHTLEPDSHPDSEKRAATKKRKSIDDPVSASAKKRKTMSASLSASSKKQRKTVEKPVSSSPSAAKKRSSAILPSSHPLTIRDGHVYVIKALEGWRSDEEAKLSVPTIGVFQSVKKANEVACEWLKRGWPKEYENVREEVGESGGVALEMVTDKDDGIVFVWVERWEVK